jgi:Septum formation
VPIICGLPRALAVVLLIGLPTACSGAPGDPDDRDPALAQEMPALGACRLLTPDDVGLPSNDTAPVDCAEEHTAETFAVGSLPDDLADAAYEGRELGSFAYRTCSKAFMKFLGADESLVMRTVLSWAWFRPSEQAWKDGARWYRCDVIGGGEQSESYVALPRTAKRVMLGRPDDRWLVCVDGDSVASSAKIPCTEPHTWRAVTTIKLGEAGDDYPGDRLAEVRTRDFCSDSVGAWLNYPVTYEFGYTWFHQAEWDAGNRRSVCWAQTDS